MMMTLLFDEVRQLPGRHKTNFYALLVVKLACYRSMPTCPFSDVALVQSLLADCKRLFQNHEQNFGYLLLMLRQGLAEYPTISEQLRTFLCDVIDTIKETNFVNFFSKKTVKPEDLQCRIQRVVESHLAVNMLINPSSSMMASINAISMSIIKHLSTLKEPTVLMDFLANLGPAHVGSDNPHLALAFGRLAYTPTIADVIEILRSPQNIETVLLIHFMFMRDAYHYFKPVISPAMNLQAYQGDFGDYLKSKSKTQDPRMFFFDYVHSAPHLYTDRGRGPFDFILSSQMGIAVDAIDRAQFPELTTAWFPDCLCQQADRRSPYVSSLIKNDIPYVAGVSGMTSLLSGALVFLGQFTEKADKNYYMLAIMAFITGGGLHSIHEVLTTLQVRLGLVPEYKPFGTGVGNYHDFFTLFAYDEVVNNNIRDAWQSTIRWFCREYPQLTAMTSPQSQHQDDVTASSRSCFFWV